MQHDIAFFAIQYSYEPQIHSGETEQFELQRRVAASMKRMYITNM